MCTFSGEMSPTIVGSSGQFESMSPGDVESISEGDIPETEAGEEMPVSNLIHPVGGVSTGSGAKTPPTPPRPSSPALAAADTESPQQAAGNGSGNVNTATVGGTTCGTGVVAAVAPTQQEAFEPILSDDELPDDQVHDSFTSHL